MSCVGGSHGDIDGERIVKPWTHEDTHFSRRGAKTKKGAFYFPSSRELVHPALRLQGVVVGRTGGDLI